MEKWIRPTLEISSGYTADGRKPFGELYAAFSALEKDGWHREDVILSERENGGETLSLPVLSYRTQKQGPAVWIIGGIHGEEPAGPNALAEGISYIQTLGWDTPVVLLPVCNPLGYATNWRYLNMPRWMEGVEEYSAGDSEHVLPDPQNSFASRRNKASCAESAALTQHVLKLARDYPPLLSLDLHEDNLIDAGYIYSQGGPEDPVARRIVTLLSATGIAIKMDGETRFGEPISGGIVGQTSDGSIDELISAEKVIVDGRAVPGPGAKTAIVVETPAALPLENRVCAYLEILRHASELASLTRRNP